MKLKYLFYAQTIVLINAVAFLFLPDAILGQFGVDADEELTLAFRNTGGLLLFLGMVAWLAARSEDSLLRRGIRLAFLVTHSVLFTVYAATQLTGGTAFGPVIWVHLAFALAFGYFQFVKPDA